MPDILGAVGNALGLTGNGEISKLRIESWTDIQRNGTSDKIFTAFINPEEFTLNYNVSVDNGRSDTPGTVSILGIAPLEITLKFFLDGTGANGHPCDVAGQISRFYEVVGYDEKQHSTRYLRIFWGNLTLLRSNHFALDCILKSASVQYKLFNANGTPKRAIITASFTEALSKKLVALEFPKSSPDLTHVRIVKEGDTLPAMVYEIYGNFKYYLEVARANSLRSFRNLQPGQKIFFPPFEKNVSKKSNG